MVQLGTIRMGTVDFLRSAAQLAPATASVRLGRFREHLDAADLPLAAEELTWIGLEYGLGSGFWEPLAAACARMGLDPRDPEHGGWVGIVLDRASGTP